VRWDIRGCGHIADRGGRDAAEDISLFDDLAELLRRVRTPDALRLVGHAELRRGQSVDVAIREGVDEDAVGHAEHRGSGADAERKRKNGGDREGPGCGGTGAWCDGSRQAGSWRKFSQDAQVSIKAKVL
jgi:hypothetical protein